MFGDSVLLFLSLCLDVCLSAGSIARSQAVHRTTDDVRKLLESTQELQGSNLEHFQ